MHAGVIGKGSLASFIIALLSEFYDTSPLTPENLGNHVDLVSWKDNDIIVRWNH